jgi:hypothetical protein
MTIAIQDQLNDLLALKLAPIVTDFNSKQSALSAEISDLKSQLASTSIQFNHRIEESTIIARSESSTIMQMLADITANMVRTQPTREASTLGATLPTVQQRAFDESPPQTWQNMMIDVLKHPSDAIAMAVYEKWYGKEVQHLGHDDLLNPIYKHRRARLQFINDTGSNITLGPNDGGQGSYASGWISLRNTDPNWLKSPADNAHSAEEFLTSKGLPLQTRFPGFGEWKC